MNVIENICDWPPSTLPRSLLYIAASLPRVRSQAVIGRQCWYGAMQLGATTDLGQFLSIPNFGQQQLPDPLRCWPARGPPLARVTELAKAGRVEPPPIVLD